MQYHLSIKNQTFLTLHNLGKLSAKKFTEFFVLMKENPRRKDFRGQDGTTQEKAG